MYKELMFKVIDHVNDSSKEIKAAFNKCKSHEDAILLKKTLIDIINDECELRQEQL